MQLKEARCISYQSLSFEIASFKNFTTKIGNLQNSIHNLINIECRIKYVAEVRKTQTGAPIWNAVLYDETGHIFFVAWDNSMFSLSENDMLFITNLRWKDNYGLELGTTRDSTFSYSKSELVPKLIKLHYSRT